MPRLARRQPERLWRRHPYPMHEIACGLPVECIPPTDYRCAHPSVLVGLRRFRTEHDVVLRYEPLFSGARNAPQRGWLVQFFWDLYPSRGDAIPADFVWPAGDASEVIERHGPFVRDEYAGIPSALRAPVQLG
jgi:hypothetical protein